MNFRTRVGAYLLNLHYLAGARSAFINPGTRDRNRRPHRKSKNENLRTKRRSNDRRNFLPQVCISPATLRLLVFALILVFARGSLAQSNVYSLSIYGGGVSYSPILVAGPFRIFRCSYWTDTNGYTLFLVGNPGREIQPGDKKHVYTQIGLGARSLSIPMPPTTLAIIAVLAIIAFVSVLIALRHRSRASTG